MPPRSRRRSSRVGTPSFWTVSASLALTLVATGFSLAQFRGASRLDRSEPTEIEVDPQFPDDVFTIGRIRYKSWGSSWDRPGEGWQTDYPDSDWNFTYRLQELTSLKVKLRHEGLELTDEALFDHPFIYIVEPIELYFEPDEVDALRRYLLKGGFLLVDDLWGDEQWNSIYGELKKVFPDREPIELELDHEIFHCVYDLQEKPQVPSIHAARRGREAGITWQGGADARIPHYRAFLDDGGHIAVLICHNTDIGDGWEREGEDEWYFREFSEKKSYPMGINIVVYAMTH